MKSIRTFKNSSRIESNRELPACNQVSQLFAMYPLVLKYSWYFVALSVYLESMQVAYIFSKS